MLFYTYYGDSTILGTETEEHNLCPQFINSLLKKDLKFGVCLNMKKFSINFYPSQVSKLYLYMIYI